MIKKFAPKAFLLGSLLALFGCLKDTEPQLIDNGDQNLPSPCMCVSWDYTQYSRDLVNQIPEEDTYGRAAYLEWYEENLQTEVVDPECCHDIVPVDPEWDAKCQEWIDNYLAGNEICEDEDE